MFREGSSPVTCHISRFTCHMSRVMCHIFFTKWWVCYLPYSFYIFCYCCNVTHKMGIFSVDFVQRFKFILLKYYDYDYEFPVFSIPYILYSVYYACPVSCIPCILYSLYSASLYKEFPVSCIPNLMYSMYYVFLYPIFPESCLHSILYFLYPVFIVFCIPCIL